MESCNVAVVNRMLDFLGGHEATGPVNLATELASERCTWKPDSEEGIDDLDVSFAWKIKSTLSRLIVYLEVTRSSSSLQTNASGSLPVRDVAITCCLIFNRSRCSACWGHRLHTMMPGYGSWQTRWAIYIIPDLERRARWDLKDLHMEGGRERERGKEYISSKVHMSIGLQNGIFHRGWVIFIPICCWPKPIPWLVVKGQHIKLFTALNGHGQ